MDSATKKADVEWNKDGRPVNWNGRDWQLYKCMMIRYLACYEVKENDWPLDDICDGSVTYQSTTTRDEERRFMREDQLLAKIISSSLSCTLARQVMRFDYGSEMWEYLSKRFEGRENATTKLYTQRTLRQKLENASCRPGADVENHLLYMLSLREQLAALDADVSDVWMVDLMVRSMSQYPYYSQLQTLMLLGGTQTLSTPEEAKAMILILEKNAIVEKQLHARRVTDTTGQPGKSRGDGPGGGGSDRGGGGNGGKSMPSYQNRSQNKQSGGNANTPPNSKKRSEQEQQQFDDDRSNRNCFECHQPGHIRRDCPNKVKQESESSTGNGNGNDRGQANYFTVSSGIGSHEQQGPAQKQDERVLPDGVQQSSTKPKSKPEYRAEQWVFDNGATQHLAGDKRYFVNYRDLTPEERERATVYGYNGESSPEGIGSIDLWVTVDDDPVALRVDNVYYSPKRTNLFSQSAATEQGFQTSYDDSTREYTLSMNGAVALKINVQSCKLWILTAENGFLSEKKTPAKPIVPTKMVNFAISDGVADLQCWHERLGHICPQFVKQMADQGLVEGMMLRNRKFDLCEACQLGKQKAKTPQRNLDRGVSCRNQLVCADLLFPPSNYNCTRFKAVLVIMDAHTRFVTAYPVQTKHKDVINPLIKRYVAWAERNWPDHKVKEILTDGGGEFTNGAITAWYQQKGITHTPTPPNTSRLNMVERTHQTLTGMMKSMMKDSGFPTSFWVEALHYAVYIKNRVFSSPINCTPYEEMWGRKPDIHHLRKFGALAYVHTKVGPSRHKFADNCRIGYVLGYRDGLLGCKVYFPSEGTVQVAGQVTVNEKILYKDRHSDGFDSRVRDWIVAEHPDLTSTGRRDYDLPVAGGGSDETIIDNNARESAEPRDEVYAGESGPAWLRKPLPSFSDDVVLHPGVSRKSKPSERTRITEGEHELDGELLSRDSGVSDLSDDDFGRAELAATDELHGESKNHPESEKREEKPRRGGLVEVAETEGEDISVEEMQVYAAFAAIALTTEVQEPQQRVWHISEVRTPRTVSQAMNSPQRAEWWKGMEKEIATMIEKDVLELVPESEMPEGAKPLETMWRFQPKTDEFGNVLRFRPRLCGRGDKEVPGIDFCVQDTFSPVARMASFRMFVALCKILKLLAFQDDIDTAYLNAQKRLVQFIRRIAGFPLKPGWLYKVKRALYGLHESGREWYDELHGWLSEKGLQRSSTEPCLYSYSQDGVIAIVLVYVDDIICATNKASWKTRFFAELNEKYGLKDMGRLSNYLGIQVDWQEDGVLLHQSKYAQEVLERFGFAGAVGCRSPMDTTVKLRAATKDDKEPGLQYREAIGALMYLATSTRPDLAFPVGYLSRFVQHPNVAHAGALKRVMRYLAATKNHGVFFKNEGGADTDPLEIDGFVDADWGNCPDTRRSVTGYVMLMAGGPVAWAARRQSIVALSTAEAEYAAACEACQEGQTIKNILMELSDKRGISFKLGVDNQAAIVLATRPTFSRKTRHIELRLHYVREMARQEGVKLWKVSGDENPADLLTKPLGFLRLDKMKGLIGMRPKAQQTPREIQRQAFRERVLKQEADGDAED